MRMRPSPRGYGDSLKRCSPLKSGTPSENRPIIAKKNATTGSCCSQLGSEDNRPYEPFCYRISFQRATPDSMGGLNAQLSLTWGACSMVPPLSTSLWRNGTRQSSQTCSACSRCRRFQPTGGEVERCRSHKHGSHTQLHSRISTSTSYNHKLQLCDIR